MGVADVSISRSRPTLSNQPNISGFAQQYSFFRFWDDIFGGTNKQYKEWCARQAAGEKVTTLETTYEPEKSE